MDRRPRYPPYQLIRNDDAWDFKAIGFESVPLCKQQYVGRRKVEAKLRIPAANVGKQGIVAVHADEDVFKESDKGRQLSLGWPIPSWKADTWYPDNSYVVQEGKIFKCIKGGKSSRDVWKPTTDVQQTEGGCRWEAQGVSAEDKKAVGQRTPSQVIWAQGRIDEFKTTRHVLLDIGSRFPAQDSIPTENWSFGEWGQEEGYPSLVTFYEDRLVFAGNRSDPQCLHFSKHSDFKRFSPVLEDGFGKDLKSLFSVPLGSVDSQVIQWLRSMESGLFVGTDSTVWLLSSSSAKEGISDSTRISQCLGGVGGVSIPPILVDVYCVFVQDSGRVLMSIVNVKDKKYSFTDLNVFAEHMLPSGIKEIVVQRSPYSIIWVLRRDGELMGCTFDPDNEILAWHSHSLGGTGARVCSMTSFTSSAEGQAELWFLVERTDFKGETVKSLEKLGRFRRDNTYQDIDMIDGLSA